MTEQPRLEQYDLIGCYKIKLNKQGVRLVYRVEDDALIVMVMAVDRREDSLVYRSALARIVETVKTLANAAKTALARDASVRPAGRPPGSSPVRYHPRTKKLAPIEKLFILVPET